MRVDRRFVVVMSISMVWALLVAGIFYRAASGAGAHSRAEAMKPIVVAAKALPAGAMIDRESLKLRSVPENLVPVGAFNKVDDVLDRPVVSGIQADEPVVEARIAARGSGTGLAPLIPSGMRAISVRVNDVAGVAGFVLPGMRVDVLFTGRPANQADTVTRTVLQDVQVLSAGQTTQTDGRSQPIVVPVVTLLVNPADAESLTLANGEGRIQLVLRNSGDRQVAVTRGRKLREIFSALPAPEPVEPVTRTAPQRARVAPPEPTNAPVAQKAVAVAVHPAPAVDEVIVINGKVKTREVFARPGGPQ
ncbi:MAG: hypothetical protein JWP63_6930 [Candidatus Solibacter sp.]|nr:hypothetical protein [Candidatus Solibacter sp.]